MKGRVLIIAGSDPSGGAGVQADIKTVTVLGGYAAAAITSLTVQNTTGVSAVHAVVPEIIRAQIEAVMSDIGADVVKIGMIGSVAAGEAILEGVNGAAPIVLDPVLAATSGDALAEEALAGFIKGEMLSKCYLATPNAIEAEALTGIVIRTLGDQRRAAARLLELGVQNALVKGGHMNGAEVCDLLLTPDGENTFKNPRIEATSTHGTGCTLASAIAAGLAQKLTLERAVERAIAYVREAIKTAPGLGAAAGPLNHACRVEPDDPL